MHNSHTNRWGELPPDYVSLHDRCQKLMQNTEGFIYPGLTPERLEGAYIERHRWLALLDYAELHFKSGREMIAWLQQAGSDAVADEVCPSPPDGSRI